ASELFGLAMLGPNQLERDQGAVDLVPRLPHRPHAAPADQALDAIASELLADHAVTLPPERRPALGHRRGALVAEAAGRCAASSKRCGRFPPLLVGSTPPSRG